MPPSSAPTKQDWRAQFREYRQSLTPPEYRARSTLLIHRALALPEVAHAQTVHVYWPLPQQCEVDTRPLIETLRRQGIEIVLPVVTSFDPDAPTLEHRRYEGPSSLARNRWDIPEPTSTKRMPTDAFDVVLVPALGADRRGHRIGHGSGYYDAFLKAVGCPRIGLVYDACLVPQLPFAPHDIPMTSLVTERTVVKL